MNKRRKWTVRIHTWIGQSKYGIAVYAKRRYARGGFQTLDNCPQELIDFLGAEKRGARWTMPEYKSIDALLSIDGHFTKGARRGTIAIIHVEIEERRHYTPRPLKQFIRQLANELSADNPWSIYRSVYKYTACGPSLGMLVGDKWYYCDDLHKLGTFEDMKRAGQEVMGVSVSSIVEGSDAEVPGDVLIDNGKMPTVEEFWKLVEAVNEEACFYWDRDNSQWYLLKKSGDDKATYSFHNTWGEIEWHDDSVPKKLRKAAEEFISGEVELNIGEYVDLPGIKGWMISEYYNDATY